MPAGFADRSGRVRGRDADRICRRAVFDECGTEALDWTLTMRVNGGVVLRRSDYGWSEEYYVRIEEGEVVDVGVLDRSPRRPARAAKS